MSQLRSQVRFLDFELSTFSNKLMDNSYLVPVNSIQVNKLKAQFQYENAFCPRRKHAA